MSVAPVEVPRHLTRGSGILWNHTCHPDAPLGCSSNKHHSHSCPQLTLDGACQQLGDQLCRTGGWRWLLVDLQVGQRNFATYSILEIAGGVLLRDEESIEVPETRLNKPAVLSVGVAAQTHSIRGAHLLVDISSKPISKKICLSSVRTLLSGCSAPAGWVAPRALKL